jgi:nitrate reductase alpha subunit
MTEARYRGQKVVTVSPGLRRQRQVRRRVAPCPPGTDGALAMAMGHVMLKEFFVDRRCRSSSTT